MDNIIEKQKKSTELNEGDRKVLYKYASHHSERVTQLQNVEDNKTLNNSISYTEKQYYY
ncbi:hypothetical protein EHE19_008885 [Ruminiclostridium herbifermentans]|uniref:Uncharacterized protein n=1 Tax=Ruminiclostridium herbifermentans TaxID=2488810 RepID=A0A7H1VSY3_9FIRM|nr:hypothetical protein [Ruminiclostridium herbifermentans]QNU68495.1 hypothetical protein EHE19_008885 [Ruminiclostridium herbifermentans]